MLPTLAQWRAAKAALYRQAQADARQVALNFGLPPGMVETMVKAVPVPLIGYFDKWDVYFLADDAGAVVGLGHNEASHDAAGLPVQRVDRRIWNDVLAALNTVGHQVSLIELVG